MPHEVQGVWRAIGKLTRAQAVMENYIHGEKQPQDYAEMRVYVLDQVEACLADLRSALMARITEGDDAA